MREINLIAQDLTAYGRDLRPRASLAQLLRELDRIEGLHWIRLLYCYPNFVTDELLETIADLPRVVKYIDMPLQHADDDDPTCDAAGTVRCSVAKLLERMRRRVPGLTLRTSFIVGFPGETDAGV